MVDRNTEDFYLVHNHNKLCDQKNIKIFDNIANIDTNIQNLEEYKNNLINYLNSKPLISIYAFKKHAFKVFYTKKKCEFTLKQTTLANIYYPWRTNSKLFSWVSIFDNYKTKDEETFLKDERTCYIYDEKNKQFIWHKHII